MDRKEFVKKRNAMFGKLREMDRIAPHMARVERRSGAYDQRTGTFHGAGAHKKETERLANDYKRICEISRNPTPSEEEYLEASELFNRWHLYIE